MIHIVFQHADIAILQRSMEMDKSLEGEIMQVRDEFAVGPIADLETDEGWNARRQWWRELLATSPYQKDALLEGPDDRRLVDELKTKLSAEPAEEVWIWVGQNQHDVCGYYWLIAQLKEFQGRISILFLNNLPFINEKGQIFYPKAIHEVLPKEILKAKKLNRKVTISEFEVDPDEWQRIVSENALVRILEGGKKIVSKGADFYDSDILNGLTGEWQKGNRALHNIFARMKTRTGDLYLLWRMKHLAAEGKLEMHGDPAKGWKEFELKRPSAVPVEVAEGPENNP